MALADINTCGLTSATALAIAVVPSKARVENFRLVSFGPTLIANADSGQVNYRINATKRFNINETSFWIPFDFIR